MYADLNSGGVYDALSEMEEGLFRKSSKTTTREILAAKVRHLTKQRDELKMKLQQECPSENCLDSNLTKKLMEIHWIWKLLGISVEILGKGDLHIRFTTSCRGVFYESYSAYVKQVNGENDNRYALLKHDLPSFFCPEDLSSWMEHGIEMFLSRVYSHLNAFIRRREELNSAKELFKDWMSCVALSGVTFIKLTLDLSHKFSKSLRLQVTLTYGDLMESLPSVVEILALDAENFDVKLQKNWTEIFKSYRLTDAISRVTR